MQASALVTSPFRTRFPKQLGFWTFHGIFNALPSFIIAFSILKCWANPLAVAAMVLAIALFIVAFAVMTSLNGPLSDNNHVFSKSLRLGVKIRSWMACMAALCAFSPATFLTPDLWCGFIASIALDEISRNLGIPASLMNSFGKSGFLPVFALSLFDGLILSVLVLLISFVCLIVLRAMERKMFFGIRLG